jgi:hypothetical protein
MDQTVNGKEVAIIQPPEPHVDQKMIVAFIKNEVGNDCVTISFEPEIPEVRTPAQAAAVNVANHIIRSFGLGKTEEQGEQNGETTKAE